ncbi:hypothetical protein F8271_28015 [Micromonospora sp. ALFpr18c]|uniref:hypothetical protein n=1 Tax=unclassified Micromonospora TaxID=2617518 RepID=UPI00124B64A1|nr:hypothetical protein [Micromonospora sp. ALFpr18c]KAB1929935.1 hypothetical protein F8271_28015 [Micromonospora sp. ALFpr18c]
MSKARRTAHAQTPRDELRRRVATAVAAAGSQDEFFARLRGAGILVRLRYSTTNPRRITGYAVALLGVRTAAGQPVYFGGGRLAPDMTLPNLRLRWGTPTLLPAAPPVGRTERVAAMRQAAKVVTVAAGDIRRDAHAAPGRAQAIAVAAADLLTSLASTVEGYASFSNTGDLVAPTLARAAITESSLGDALEDFTQKRQGKYHRPIAEWVHRILRPLFSINCRTRTPTTRSSIAPRSCSACSQRMRSMFGLLHHLRIATGFDPSGSGARCGGPPTITATLSKISPRSFPRRA